MFLHLTLLGTPLHYSIVAERKSQGAHIIIRLNEGALFFVELLENEFGDQINSFR